MSWFVSILVGLVMAAFGALYGGFMANAAVKWLRISSFEGGSGYFVVFLGLGGLIAGLVLGIVVSRYLGGPGWAGFGKALGWSVLVVGGGISVLGGVAWLSEEREPLIAGQPIDLVIELSAPAELEAQVRGQPSVAYVVLFGGKGTGQADLDLDRSRQEDGRWIVGARIAIGNASSDRMLGAALRVVKEQYWDLPLPGKPALMPQWSEWMRTPFYGDRSTPPPDAAYAMRYRIEHRPEPSPPSPPEPPQPTAAELKAQAFKALKPDAPTEEWLAFTGLDVDFEIRKAATAELTKRADLGPKLAARIGSEDPVVARDAMYLVGEMHPPPAEVADAVRAWVRKVVSIAEAIDPAAEDSRDRLYELAHVPATGVTAAAFGLRRAGVDIRPELRALATATYEREKASPRSIADSCERIIAYFDKLDREYGVGDRRTP